MSNVRLLLLSNSRNYGKGYLEHAEAAIKDSLRSAAEVLFIPYASVRFSYDEFAEAVGARFKSMGYRLRSIHTVEDKPQAVKDAEAFIAGGGNTFQLLRELYKVGVVDAIRERAMKGVPYIGWSAGANIACPTIKTTNDMPIVEPPSLDALGLLSFQINPHYTDYHPPEHQGETREERLIEFTLANPDVCVVALREGSMLRVEASSVQLIGDKPARVFRKGVEPVECDPGQMASFIPQSS